MNGPTLEAEQTCIAGYIRRVEERLVAVDAPLAEWEKVLSLAMRFATTALAPTGGPSRKPVGHSTKPCSAGSRVRDGRIAHMDCHEPFDLLFNAPQFEYGDLVVRTGQRSNRPVAW